MRQLNEIAKERDLTATVVDLTRAFEGIASMRISKIKDQTEQSARFFAEFWQIYTQLTVDELFHFGRRQAGGEIIEKELMVLITSEGSFSGDIDQRLIKEALDYYKAERNDIVIIGHHGAVQLAQRNVPFVRNFKLPSRDTNINTEPLVQEVQKYASTVVFYTSYISLMVQKIKRISLSTAVAERGKTVAKSDEIISEANYIFEPSTYAVVDHLERTMIGVALSEVILESKLAQYASRFKAMNVAHHKADDSLADLRLTFNRARRNIKDERTKEIINGMKAGAVSR